MNDETIQSHCGSNAFSPPAPPELCNSIHHAPEPATLGLILLACIIYYIIRRRK